MRTSELVIATPNYVLMDQMNPFGANVVDSKNLEWTAIFGFSEKSRYETFCSKGSTSLTPYPLVKGYLRNQVANLNDGRADEQCRGLIVLDSLGPSEPLIHAVTMQAVLHAHENRTTHMTPTHHLVFDTNTSTYRSEETAD